jgi:hypothetical protein
MIRKCEIFDLRGAVEWRFVKIQFSMQRVYHGRPDKVEES